jgi:hypothetical protein
VLQVEADVVALTHRHGRRQHHLHLNYVPVRECEECDSSRMHEECDSNACTTSVTSTWMDETSLT